ncbi:MAG: disulfide bond formation protein B [Bosea sp.]|jgi:disulfide bond formation protein DsbB|uniref:disulfide bond formation protein B n=1 Tax=unclassified Bosea (in: a-proteobacteria) TaxID=2653178 RepID=UPI0009627A74|nr:MULTISPECIES: disulfide bond formation protein B [unclassified Bosea (in: a-proteobacteria)]MBN9459309.1 disulfide bond formation protein B [Bosea sp. (in: a-proteobacteria)]OJV04552.1 MAG: disulfide bond formation protein [Bosea sp. 67-29]TAJ31776.1 MAG: disulfide bond formation protein B [Bosea sp. (in: a-proteobacteria)]
MTNPSILPDQEGRWSFLYLAWLVALVASLSALFIGEVMGQAPCSLCWQQRAFMFPLAILLAIASFRADTTVWRYALPLAALGAAIALFHSLLYAGLIPEGIQPCSQGPSCASAEMTVLGVLPLPYLSLAAFLAIVFALLASKSKAQS